jgi:hypothetical protein
VWLEAGGSYLLATNQARTGSPEVYYVEGDQIVVLPRLLKDDYNVFVQDGAMKADRLTEADPGHGAPSGSHSGRRQYSQVSGRLVDRRSQRGSSLVGTTRPRAVVSD